MKMDQWEILKLRDLPIEGVAERLGIKVTRHKALCPFHPDRHPSLSFQVRRNVYRCFVCGACGDGIDLVMRYRSVNFLEACQWLAGGAVMLQARAQLAPPSPPLPPPDLTFLAREVEHPFLTEAARRFLFDERRLHPAVVRWLGISSTSTHLLIPYKDCNGRLLTVQKRYLGSDGREPRFRFPRGMPCPVFNYPVLPLLRPGEELYLSEGVTDCMALLSSGRKAIALPSATVVCERDLEVVKRYATDCSLHLFPDRDEPGERLFLRLQQFFPDLVRHSLPEGCKDFSDYYVLQRANEMTMKSSE